MDNSELLAGRFQEHRPHLRAGADDVQNLKAWLTTIVARVCLNMLRSRNTRREEPAEVCVPDPIVGVEGGSDPEQEALLADSVGLALQVVIDNLAPAERLAFVLHDMFDLPFKEIAPMIRRTPQAARQLASRARRRVKEAEIAAPSAIRPVNEPPWMPSSPPAAPATSTPLSPCSTPTWWPVPTSAPGGPAGPR